MGEAISSGWLTSDAALEIATPHLSDIPRLAALSKDPPLTEESWRRLVNSSSVVSSNTAGAAGIYLADHYSLAFEDDRLRELQAARNVLCNRFKLGEHTVAFGAHCVVAPEWRDTDLRSQLLRSLLRMIGFRRRHLFRFCRKDDPAELDTLKFEGWRCFQEEDETCYFMLDVAKALRGLSTRLALRFPPRRVEPLVRTAIQNKAV
jgi:hypothetical protein